MAFNIEKVKWTWPATVKRPDVYRDDEFVIASSKEEAIKSIDFLLNKPQGLTYTITVERDGNFYTYYRHSMPCLGGLTGYKDSHGEKYSFNPYFPRDIRVAFPKGNVVFVGFYSQGILKSLETPYNKFILSKESPWIAAFNNKDSIIFKDNYWILTDMNIFSTVLYSLIRLGGFGSGGYNGSTKKDWNPKADILISKCSNSMADPRRLAGQRPIITGGKFSENLGYCRPFCEFIFSTSIPCKMKDFKNLTTIGYPPSPKVSNEYFKTTMQEKFGVDILKQDEKLHEALVKSWDYFRKESRKLSDSPGD